MIRERKSIFSLFWNWRKGGMSSISFQPPKNSASGRTVLPYFTAAVPACCHCEIIDVKREIVEEQKKFCSKNHLSLSPKSDVLQSDDTRALCARGNSRQNATDKKLAFLCSSSSLFLSDCE